MSRHNQAPPPTPDDDDYSPEHTRLDRVKAELARRTELVAVEDRAIAQAEARRAARLVELQCWADDDPLIAAELHGNPDHILAAEHETATLTEDQARAAAFARWDDREVIRRTLNSELACLLNKHERTIERLINQALVLYSTPSTFDALADGSISYRHALNLVDQMQSLPAEQQSQFEEAVLPIAKSQPVGRFTDKARRLREQLHPDSIVTRSTTAFEKRHIYWEAAADGMGWLHWYGTASDTKAACDRINTIAIELKALHTPSVDDDAGNSAENEADEEEIRSLDQLRADFTAALLLDGITPDGMGGGITGTVMVTVPVFTLMGLSDEPGHLDGYGPIPPDQARDLAAHAPSFTRLLVHPISGTVLTVDKNRFRVPKDLKNWVLIRDETCRFPGCTRPAVTSDLDHTEEHQHGGATASTNLAHLCEPHHRLKHLSQWTVTQHDNGVLNWVSPAGRRYHTDPATPMGLRRPEPPSVGPRTRPTDRNLVPRRQPKRHPTTPVPTDPPF